MRRTRPALTEVRSGRSTWQRRWGCGRRRLDDLSVHESVAVSDFDQHGAEPTLPHIAQHTFGAQWEVDLRRWLSSGENFGKQGSVHGNAVRRPPRGRPTKKRGSGRSKPAQQATRPSGQAVGLGLVVLAVGAWMHGKSSWRSDTVRTSSTVCNNDQRDISKRVTRGDRSAYGQRGSLRAWPSGMDS